MTPMELDDLMTGVKNADDTVIACSCLLATIVPIKCD
jgi:hypothetical protein